jgi:hypothetical protein
MPDPAADQFGCPGAAMPAHGNERQVDVLAVPEHAARGHDFRQDLGQVCGHGMGHQ